MFTLARRATPQRIPGNIAFGGWNIIQEPDYVIYDDDKNKETYNVEDVSLTTVSPDDFTTFTIIFSPTGGIVSKVNGKNIVFDDTDKLFAEVEEENKKIDPPRLWDHDLTGDIVPDNLSDAEPELGEPGATIVTLFEYPKFDTAQDRNAFLDENAQYLPINLHTGQPFRRK